MVAALVGAFVAAPAHAATGPTRTEAPVASTSPDAALVKESYVRLYAPLPESDGARPAACDWIAYLRFRSASGPATAWKSDAIFVTMPGIFAGAASLDQFARNVVRAAAQRGRHVEVWTLDRRSNCVEDHRGVEVAARDRNPKLGFDYYYHGGSADGHTFPGFATAADTQFLSGVGLDQTVRDEYTVITREVPSDLRTKKVICGGHSLGGPLTAAFADWDFDGNPDTTQDAGYNQCAAYVALDTRFGLGPGQDSSSGGSQPSSLGFAQAAAAASKASPFVDAPPFTPETIEATPLIAMAADLLGGQESHVAEWLPDDQNFEASYRLLFSRDAVDAVTQMPSWRDFRTTYDAALAAIFDDNSSPIVILRASLGTFDGGPVVEKSWPAPYGGTLADGLIDGKHLMTPDTPHGPLYGWRNYDRGGLPGTPSQVDSHGEPYTSRGSEVTDLHELARAWFEAPADFPEQYFPTHLLSDQESAANGDRSGDLQNLRYDGIPKRPAFYADAESGIEEGAAPPPNGPAPQSWIKLPGFNHIDVGTAAWRQNNGRPEPESAALVDWMERIVGTASAKHPAHHSRHRGHHRHRRTR